MVDAPRITPPAVSGLEPGDGLALGPRELAEGLRFTAAIHGDLTDAVFDGCEFDGVELDGAVLRGTRFADCRLVAIHAATFDAPRSQWRDSEVESSRLGGAVLHDAELSRMVFRGLRIDYANLAGATLTDVLFERCTFGELDLAEATGTRVAFTDCSVGTLDVTRAALTQLDLRGCELRTLVGIAGLRGATVDESQLLALGPLLAAEAGIEVALRGPQGPAASG
jgi:uncharacterized protein YjbI with pentapeptide repeats